ncbi:YciI family protein [Microlunatus soli]|uniref:YCII-related domain-containing protein n=1 Tax=Microlunatus soli TaxID=630515 RepID=A0A1H1N0M9_9ACTN|nr:YciI family protein [Microlunatus soli]SDR92701.1 hypothetical protein SAMN04489812_0335 [Microlunatus soli]
MEFLTHHRDRADAGELRARLVERHWSFMDRYERQLIARGPTLDRLTGQATGSVHLVELPSPRAARNFALDDPNYQAGVSRDVLVRRWQNLLGRTMWEFPGGEDGPHRYFVLGLAPAGDLDVSLPADTSELIAYGPLLSDDGGTRLGVAALVRAADPTSARQLFGDQAYATVEVHDWEFGGRP